MPIRRAVRGAPPGARGPRRRVPFVTGRTLSRVGASLYTAAVSGGVLLAGAADLAKVFTPTISGGIQTTGGAATSKGKAYPATGAIQTTGGATVAAAKVFAGSGPAVLVGSADSSKTHSFSGVGGAQTDGAAQTSLTSAGSSVVYPYDPSGGLSTGSAAATSYLQVAAAAPVGGGGGGSFYLRRRQAPAREYRASAWGLIDLSGAARTMIVRAQPAARSAPTEFGAREAVEYASGAVGGCMLAGSASAHFVEGAKPAPELPAQVPAALVNATFEYRGAGDLRWRGAAAYEVRRAAKPQPEATVPVAKATPIPSAVIHTAAVDAGRVKLAGASAARFVAAAVRQHKAVASQVKALVHVAAAAGNVRLSGAAPTQSDGLGLGDEELLAILEFMWAD
jgi:hypothetical protein